jgi:rhamnogalacturonan endolyase
MFLIAFATVSRAADAPPATAAQDEQTITLDNGLIRLSLDRKKGQVTSIQLARDGQPAIELAKPGEGLYWDANVDLDQEPANYTGSKPRAGYSNISRYGPATSEVTQNGPDRAAFVVKAGPTVWLPFEVEFHVVLPRGERGFYAYTVMRHSQGMPGCALAQTRLVLKSTPGKGVFTHTVVDDQRVTPRPTSPEVETIQDATYRLADGTAHTKYDNTAFTHRYLAHGLASDSLGLWVLYPSTESFNGGPVRQDLTVHEDSIVLAMWHSSHFGAPQVKLAADEKWEKLYGPVMFFANDARSLKVPASVEALFADAKVKALAERDAWPYAWLKRDDYPLERGTVTGTVKLADANELPAGAWAVLAPAGDPPGTDWALSSRGYMFWTKVQPDGSFTIRKVRPGPYRLFLSGADQPDDFRVDSVNVPANGTTDLGTITWTPPADAPRGTKLWQIGRFDRSVTEFHNGQEPSYRNYDAFLRYFKVFPDDVTWVVGKGRSDAHWNAMQWSWFNKNPVWTVQFDVADAALTRGQATLTLGISSFRAAGGLSVKVNDQEVALIEMPKTGAAGYRSAGVDSPYNLKRIRFDASLLHPGTNRVTLGHTKAEPIPTGEALKQAKRPPGEVAYDALRLDVEAK